MNLPLPYIFLSLCLLAGSLACKNDYDHATDHPASHQHEYNSEHQHGDSPDETAPTQVAIGEGDEDDIYGSASRRNWQKPNFIIRRLGNLEGKTVADIGAGPYGYFTFRIVSKTKAEKVIAIDIDQRVTEYIDSMKMLLLSPELQQRVETRLVPPDDPQLAPGEADVVIMVNTYTYIADRVQYLRNLRNDIAEGGNIFIIDFKKRRLPLGPPAPDKLADYEVENDLIEAGYANVLVDDQSLIYQYLISATNPGPTQPTF